MPAIAKRPAEVRPIDSETQHKAYVSRLLELQRQKTLNHRESDTVRLLILVIKDYEAKRYQFEDASPIEVLRELMDANGLKQRDLVDELGSDSIVSEVLNGKRELNKNHIEKLSNDSIFRQRHFSNNHQEQVFRPPRCLWGFQF